MKPHVASRTAASPPGAAPPGDARTQELQDAFTAFSRLSENLTDSYQALEARVAELTAELGVARDERRVQRAEKEQLADRLQSLLQGLPGGVVVLDGDGKVQECNPAAVALLGEPLLGKAWREVIVRAFAPRGDDGHEISLRDGRRVSIATTPLGTAPGQILLLTDVTEPRRLQERLNHHKRLSAMGEMAASLAHQIRTPLASVLLYASHLGRANLEASERQRIGEKIQARMRHLEQLVNDMLLFARGGSVGGDVVTIDELLQPAYWQAGGDAGLQLENQLAGARLYGNREALLSALQNLVTNARQAGGSDCHVRLCARPVDGQAAVDLLVVDDGPGVPAEVQARLFEPFFTTRSQGTGLGLAVVRAVAEAHHGSAWFASATGVGSTFALRLPLLAADTSSSETSTRSHA
jgi:two-component system sensor histidine kinase FlrB